MRREEAIAEKFLKKTYAKIVYEPDGNIPPDFLIDDSVAVEVRRLNQNIKHDDTFKGIEIDQIKLKKIFESILRTYDTLKESDSYWIVLEYKRPIGDLKEIRKAAKIVLDSILENPMHIPQRASLNKSVSIEIVRASQKSTRKYRIGIEVDFDSGGWVAPLYIDNVGLCISEKSKKIGLYKKKYKTWWLLLVDFLCNGISDPEKTMAYQDIMKQTFFDRIIVINPIDLTVFLEIPS